MAENNIMTTMHTAYRKGKETTEGMYLTETATGDRTKKDKGIFLLFFRYESCH